MSASATETRLVSIEVPPESVDEVFELLAAAGARHIPTRPATSKGSIGVMVALDAALVDRLAAEYGGDTPEYRARLWIEAMGMLASNAARAQAGRHGTEQRAQ